MSTTTDRRGEHTGATILGIDPGGTTGLCAHRVESDELAHWQLGPDEHHNDLWNMLCDIAPHTVVCERFDYRRRMDNVDLIPVEYIGIIKLWCKRTNTKYVEQMQLKGKRGLWTDAKLKALGIYLPGKPHAMDATRQVLYYETVTLGDQLWVNRYGTSLE